MKSFFILFIIGGLVFSNSIQAQKIFMNEGIYSNNAINPESFNNKLFQELMIYKINYHMDSLGLEGFETHDLFSHAAAEHADIMAEMQEATLEGRGKLATVHDRLIAAGGTGIGSEMVARVTIKLSNEYITYENLAQQVLGRWSTGKFSKDLLAQKYFLAGISGKVDNTGKKIFVSMYIGNYASMKPDEESFSRLALLPTKKTGLIQGDEKTCKKASGKIPAMVDLQQGLSINENGEIVFKYNDIRKFRRLIRDDRDGLAVDIIQKSQFDDCSTMENVADYSNVNIGYMTKPVYVKNLYKNNIAQGEGKRNRVNSIEVVLGMFPDILDPDDAELNLIIIKDRQVCANIPKTYVDKKIYDFVPKITLLPDTVEIAGVNKYVPVATSTELKFRIKFQQGKYDYDPQDMVPVLDALNEPDFIINKIFIEAFSSLEGTHNENQILQKKRAQSIVKAFEANQNASIVDSIVTSTNFRDLKTDVKGTPYEEVSTMNIDDAVKYVNARSKEMESILENHRYADITMWITYDAEGDKEQNYVTDQFNKAVAAGQLDQALSIQKYIMKRVTEGIYDEVAVADMRIPQGSEYAGLNMNKIWLTQYVFMDPLNDEYLKKIEELNKLCNTNIYIEYNDILCKVELTDLTDENVQNRLQNRIDKLYNTSINVNTVDLLNIELQYQIMSLYRDSLGSSHPQVARSLAKIKEIIHFDEIKWDNSLKLATVFINHNDYEYALQLLEPSINDENVPIELLTTYVTLCTKVNGKIHSNRFAGAMERINELDQSYFCSLFNRGDKFSIQTFVNTKVKELYCKSCNNN